MRPEDRLWHKIAGRIGMPVWKVKRETSATDFLRWKYTFDEEWTTHEKWEYYAAEILYRLHLIWLSWITKPPEELKNKAPKDFFLKFTFNETTGARKKVNLDARDDPNFQIMKASVMFAVGLNPDGSVPEGVKYKVNKAPDQRK